MEYKKCSCGKMLTDKNTKLIGETLLADKIILWLNCLSCKSTMIFKTENKKAA